MACNPPGAVENCFDTSRPCATTCDDDCLSAFPNDVCLQRVELNGSTSRLCFNVGGLALCRGRPNPADWSMVIAKKGACSDLIEYLGFEFDLNGHVCFVLDSLILDLDQSKRYVARIQFCGAECGRIELYFTPCAAELFSVILGNNRDCVDYSPTPSCEQTSIVTECEASETVSIPCT